MCYVKVKDFGSAVHAARDLYVYSLTQAIYLHYWVGLVFYTELRTFIAYGRLQ